MIIAEEYVHIAYAVTQQTNKPSMVVWGQSWSSAKARVLIN
jgi:hypothetical protein